MSAHIHGWFDVQVDGQHRIDEDGILEVDAYPVYLDDDGMLVTDTWEPLASVEIPGKGYAEDAWYGETRGDTDTEVAKLPEYVQQAYKAAHKLAGYAQGPVVGGARYSVGDTVFLPEYIMPGQVVARTVDGDYIVDMGDTGELAPFSETELEDYDADKWHRP